jgi:hypothetical protein
MGEWELELDAFFDELAQREETLKKLIAEGQMRAAAFFESVVLPAYSELKPSLERHGRTVLIVEREESASIRIEVQERLEFEYTLVVQKTYARPIIRAYDPTEKKIKRSDKYLRTGIQDYTIAEISKEELMRHFLDAYMKYLKDAQRARLL